MLAVWWYRKRQRERCLRPMVLVDQNRQGTTLNGGSARERFPVCASPSQMEEGRAKASGSGVGNHTRNY